MGLEAVVKRIRRIMHALDPNAVLSRRERQLAFRIRRCVALVAASMLVIAVLTSCSVRSLLVRMTPDGRADSTAAAQSTGSADSTASAKTKTGKTKTPASGTHGNTHGGKRNGQSQDQAVAKALRAQSASLSDDERNEILSKAQETAQNSGKPVVQYHYCVTTKGDVGSADDFANAAFRILNSEHGWPRAGAVFEQSSDDGDCDFDLVLSQASQMTSFSPSCSVEYSCRVGDDVIVNDDRWRDGTESWLSAGGDLARYRTMVINHEVGHRLGHVDNETTCAGAGQPAPLMQEQSMHLDGCAVNEYPLDSELWTDAG